MQTTNRPYIRPHIRLYIQWHIQKETIANALFHTGKFADLSSRLMDLELANMHPGKEPIFLHH
jgi:hypothetical protein